MEYVFTWDLLKELKNVAKHGCAFSEAQEVFFDPDVIYLEDPQHSNEENRYYALGKCELREILTVCYTVRENEIRIFGAARWRKWRKFYEKNSRSRKNDADQGASIKSER